MQSKATSDVNKVDKKKEGKPISFRPKSESFRDRVTDEVKKLGLKNTSQFMHLVIENYFQYQQKKF